MLIVFTVSSPPSENKTRHAAGDSCMQLSVNYIHYKHDHNLFIYEDLTGNMYLIITEFLFRSPNRFKMCRA